MIVSTAEVSDWIGRSLTDPVDASAVETITAAVNSHLGLIVAPVTDPPPDDVKLAGLLLASRWYSRRNSPDGLVGFGDYGASSIRNLDPDIRDLLKKHQRRTVG